MATDDNDDTKRERNPFDFVDRDDDTGGRHVDFDYEDDFPQGDITDDSETPDPGYAAFAEDLDDPLADWPSPEAKLQDLPEVQRQQAATGPTADDPVAPAPPQASFSVDNDAPVGNMAEEADVGLDGPDTDLTFGSDSHDAEDDEGRDDYPEATFYDDPVDEGVDDDPEPFDTPESPSQDDSFYDEPVADGPLAGPDAVDRDEDPQADEAPPVSAGDMHKDPEPEPFDPSPETMEPLDYESEDEDDLVDDFLNDLDDAEDYEDEALLADFDDEEEVDDPDIDAPITARSLAPEDARPADTPPARSPRGSTSPPPAPPRSSEADEGGLPWAMIAVVVVALILLAAGGYGVIMQRSSLEAEIRELQAQLATAMPPEEAAAERERQRQIALENEALAAELEGLQAENAALIEQVATLEDQVEERAAAEAKAREQAAAAAREAEAAARKAASTASAKPAPRPAPSPAGPWFVNFGSYAQRDVAERWAAKLSVDEGKVVVQQATAAGKSLYRVRVIDLPSQDRAERVATALERQHQLPRLWVGKD